MFFQHFVECVFHFNNYEKHEKYNKFSQSERSVRSARAGRAGKGVGGGERAARILLPGSRLALAGPRTSLHLCPWSKGPAGDAHAPVVAVRCW